MLFGGRASRCVRGRLVGGPQDFHETLAILVDKVLDQAAHLDGDILAHVRVQNVQIGGDHGSGTRDNEQRLGRKLLKERLVGDGRSVVGQKNASIRNL